MSRVYTNKGKLIEYQEILSRTFYNEEDLETTVLDHLNRILVDFWTLPFKAKIEDKKNSRNKEADLAIIKKDYSEWYVVEVELQGHSLSHVQDQVETFYNCEYSDYHAKYIHDKLPQEFDLKSLKEMVQNPPKLLVIVDQIKQRWIDKLDDYNCKISEFQIFLDIDTTPAFRLKGEYPTTYSEYCLVKIQKGIIASVELLGRKGREFCNSIDLKNKDQLEIEFAGYNAKWKRNDDRNKIYLYCEDGFFPLDTSTRRYMLTYNTNSQKLRFKKT